MRNRSLKKVDLSKDSFYRDLRHLRIVVPIACQSIECAISFCRAESVVANQSSGKFATRNDHMLAYSSIDLLTGVPAPCPACVSMRISTGRSYD